MKKLLIIAMCASLSGCIYVPENHPTVRYYHQINPVYNHREVIPFRNDDYIGYMDHRGNLHLWPAK